MTRISFRPLIFAVNPMLGFYVFGRVFRATFLSPWLWLGRHMVIYSNLPLATSSVLHSDGLGVPQPPNNVTMDGDNSYNDEVHSNQVGEGTESDTTFEQSILRTSLHNSSRS